MKKKNMIKIIGTGLICTITATTIIACAPKEEVIENPTEITTVANTIDATTADILKKLTTEEALVETVSENIESDTKEVQSENNTVIAKAHIITEKFTDGSYVTHKTYVAEDINDSETEVRIYTPKDKNIIRLSDGIHKIIEKPTTNDAAETQTSTETTVMTKVSEGKFDTEKVLVSPEVIPEDKIEYEEITVTKEEFDKAVKENADRKETFVEGNKDTQEKQEKSVKKIVKEIEKTIEQPATTQSTQQTERQTETQKEETSVVNGNNNTNTNSNNNSTNNNNSSNNNTNNNSSTTTKQTEAPKQTQHTHNWVAQYKTVHHNEVSHTENKQVPYQEKEFTKTAQVYDTCTYEIIKTTYGDDAYGLAWDYVAANGVAHRKNGGCALGYREGSSIEKTVTKYKTEKVKIVDKAAYDEKILTGYKCSFCGATK